MPAAAVIGTVAGVAGSISQAKAAKKATNAQVQSAKDQIELDKAIYEDQKNMFAPYRETGELNQAILNYEMGIGPKPIIGAKAAPKVEEVKISSSGNSVSDTTTSNTAYRFGENKGGAQITAFKVGDRTFTNRNDAQAYADSLAVEGTEYGGFTATPGYEFRVKSANDALENSAATRGSLFSGQTLKDLSALNQNLAADEYNNYLARIEAGVNRGQAAAGGTAVAAGDMGVNIGVSNANIANAYAQGAIARGNAINSGVSAVTTGLTSMFSNPNGAWANPLFGGKGLGGFV